MDSLACNVFQLDFKSGNFSSTECRMLCMTDVGQSYLTTSRPYGAKNGTTELESIARRQADEAIRLSVCSVGSVS